MGAFGPGRAPATSMLEVEFAQASHMGRVRKNNEDYLGYVEPATTAQAQSHGWLFVVADGVGGQDLGELASRTAVENMLDLFRRSAGGESHAPLLRRIVQAANHAVYEAGHSAGPGGVSIATTVVACALRHDRAVVAHVGDSRCYLYRQGQVTALTRDHTVVRDQVRLGLVSANEAAQSENRHILSRSLGNDLFVSVDIAEHALAAGDVLLLCTDGFYDPLSETDMARVLDGATDLQTAVCTLVNLANDKSGRDNITAQAIRVRTVERMGMYRGRLYKLR
jgi:serine/threonine protein phosphatase PrpC